jgi:hypothetical protein
MSQVEIGLRDASCRSGKYCLSGLHGRLFQQPSPSTLSTLPGERETEAFARPAPRSETKSLETRSDRRKEECLCRLKRNETARKHPPIQRNQVALVVVLSAGTTPGDVCWIAITFFRIFSPCTRMMRFVKNAQIPSRAR